MQLLPRLAPHEPQKTNRMTTSPTIDPTGLCIETAGSRLYKFSLTYRYGFQSYGVSVWATDWDDAVGHLRAINQTGEIDGQIMAEIPVTARTQGLFGLWIKARCAVKNLFG